MRFFLVLGCFIISIASKAELVVKAISIDTNSVSNYTSSGTNYTAIYGGMAGAACTDGGSNSSTCNSCIDSSTPLRACNQKSIYANLKIQFTFQLSKAVTNAANQLEIDSSGSGTYTVLATGSSITGDVNQTFALQTTWGAICNGMGLNSSCSATSIFKATRNISIAVDGDGSGIDSTERKLIPISLHIIPPSYTPVTQAFCASTAAGTGVCKLTFTPGDEKVYISSVPLSAGTDSANSGVDWDAIAIFPVPTTQTTEAAAYTGFYNGQVSPIFKLINSDNTISDSRIQGSLVNYQHYCFIYGNRNLAQNIYAYTTTGVVGGCATPSEVVGVLADKHCFISTAAFGSEMAPEVETFRQFRNHYLLTNSLGKQFVRYYYQYSPPFAEIIAQNEVLRFFARAILYPFLAFSYVSLNYGILAAILTAMVGVILLASISKVFLKQKNFLVIMLIGLLFSVHSKSEVLHSTQKIQHPGQADGLVRINKDGSYDYEVKTDIKKESGRLFFGQASNPQIGIDIQTVDNNGNPTGRKHYDFKDFYSDSSGFTIGYNYERFPWAEKNMFGFQVGASMMYANGQGILVASPGGPAQERFSFLTVPVTLGVIYRMQWKQDQLLVPYASGGGTAVLLLEKREDKSEPNYTGGFGYYGLGGLMLNLSKLDKEVAFEMNSQYGIGNFWLSLEFKAVEVDAESFTLSNQFVNAGFSFDF